MEILPLQMEITPLHMEILPLHMEITPLHMEITPLHVESSSIIPKLRFSFQPLRGGISQPASPNNEKIRQGFNVRQYTVDIEIFIGQQY